MFHYDSLHGTAAKSFLRLVVLPLQFTKAVEAKQVAQQDAERARFVVLKADQVRFSACCSSELSITCPGLLRTRMLSCSFIFPSHTHWMLIAKDIIPIVSDMIHLRSHHLELSSHRCTEYAGTESSGHSC